MARKSKQRARRVATIEEHDQDMALYGGLVRLHILHHAAQAPVFGLWLIEELRRHGYRIGPGTLYPILHSLKDHGLLRSRESYEGRSLRLMYTATAKGRRTLDRSRARVRELFGEIFDE